MRRGLLRHTSFAAVPVLQKLEERAVVLSGRAALRKDAVVEEVIRHETQRAAAAESGLILELAELQSRFASVLNLEAVGLHFQEVVFVVDAAAVAATVVVLDGCPSCLAFGLVMV